MNWMFESRSKDYQYDEDLETGSYVQIMEGCDELLFLFFALLLAIILAIPGVLFALAVFAYVFYEIAINVAESGKLKFPRLTLTGAGIAIILPTLISKNVFAVSEHLFILFCSSVFVLLVPGASLAGLVWRLFKQKPTVLRQ